ncbi:MAG: 50S ribosomal protein L6 [Candidatus Pelagibacter sp.]|nr:50S ribosomal protein L6 [Candidatus Pelagibacter sp.]|tara:strand:+ start:15 stop:545 length:531 start_codon:yes stop_codon:yes gene_type:complete
MSRIAKNPIKISNDVQCSFKDGVFSAKGNLGQIEININSNYNVNIIEDEVKVLPLDDSKNDPNWGTTRAIVANTINGVTTGFSKTLELNGTGYRASVSGAKLKLELGYSHDINFDIPKDVKIECPKQNIIKLTSINKEKLGAAAAKIRSFRKPEPFKGKGIKYIDEYIFRKEGKKK